MFLAGRVKCTLYSALNLVPCTVQCTMYIDAFNLVISTVQCTCEVNCCILKVGVQFGLSVLFLFKSPHLPLPSHPPLLLTPYSLALPLIPPPTPCCWEATPVNLPDWNENLNSTFHQNRFWSAYYFWPKKNILYFFTCRPMRKKIKFFPLCLKFIIWIRISENSELFSNLGSGFRIFVNSRDLQSNSF